MIVVAIKGVYTPTAEEQAISVNHAVTVVGWGTENGQKYWLIQK